MAGHVVEVASEVGDLVRAALADAPVQFAAGERLHRVGQLRDAPARPAEQQKHRARRQDQHRRQHLLQEALLGDQCALDLQGAGVDPDRAVRSHEVAARCAGGADRVHVEDAVLEGIGVGLVGVAAEIPLLGGHRGQKREVQLRHRRHQAVGRRTGEGAAIGAEDHQLDPEARDAPPEGLQRLHVRRRRACCVQLQRQRVQFTVGPVLEPVLLVVVRVGGEDGRLDPQDVPPEAQRHHGQERRRQPEQQGLGEAGNARRGQLNSSVNR